MNKIKGLILKDIYHSKKNMTTAFAIIVFFLIMIYMFRFAYIYGILSPERSIDDPETIKQNMLWLDILFQVLMSAFGFFIPSQIVTSSFSDDLKCRWDKFVIASPVSEKHVIISKHIEILFGVFTCLMSSLVLNSIYCLFFKSETIGLGFFTAVFIMPFFLGALIILYLLLLMLVRKEEIVQMMIVIAGMLFGGIMSVKITELDDIGFDDLISLINSYKVTALVICAAAFAVLSIMLYFGGILILKRRDS